MAQLPLRPILFVPLYLLSIVPMAVFASASIPGAEYAYALGSGANFLLHWLWLFRTLRVASESSRGSKPFMMPVALLVAWIALLAWLAFYQDHADLLQERMKALQLDRFGEVAGAIVVGVVVLTFFAFIWVTSRRLVEAEEKRKVPAHWVVGTFLLLFYIVIGAPFVYRRLKALRETGA